MRPLLTFALVLLALPAKAWTGEPVCALEPPPQLSPPLNDEGPDEALMCMPVMSDPSGARDLSATSARDAWRRFNELRAIDPRAALLQLPRLEAALPRLSDVFALHRGELLLQLARPAEAAAAFERALEASVDSEVWVRARVGRVRAQIAAASRDAASALTELLRRYPALPEEPQLRLELARMREAQGKVSEAVRAYRRLDVHHPGSRAAALARQRLDELRDEGVRVRAYTPTERVERAERLVRRGPLPMARAELAALLEEPRLAAPLRAKVLALAAHLARHEGRWEDAASLLRRSHALGAPAEDASGRTRLEDLARAATARDRDAAERQLRQLRAGRPLTRIGTGRLLLMGRVAGRAALDDAVEAIARELVRRELPPALRLRAALELTGAARDETILELLDGLSEQPGKLGIKAAYHRGRALQRLGRWAEAELALLDVLARDTGPTPFYALWAELQLDEVRAAMVGACGPEATCRGGHSAPPASLTAAPLQTLAARDAVDGETSARVEERVDAVLADAVVVGRRVPREGLTEPTEPSPLPPVDLERARTHLEPIVKRHGDAYPWLGRARDFLVLGEAERAGRQLYEAYLAWREATGRPIRRAGRESVARGANRGRRFVGFALKQERRALDAEARAELSRIGEWIGDWGVATGFGGWGKVQARPRAYAHLVEAAARRHGVDPNLLFAVMRVESVYQKEIVSYAGAIGLCQIMPRTGQLIAHAVGRDDYDAADLLDPATNLDFAAWYLRSLIERFDGRLPLAIASYNGGPHNVRRWMADQPEDMPLDVFLEHIPFDQTHRYVRRVLTHYRAYRAQLGLPMIALTTRLPEPRTDPVAF